MYDNVCMNVFEIIIVVVGLAIKMQICNYFVAFTAFNKEKERKIYDIRCACS